MLAIPMVPEDDESNSQSLCFVRILISSKKYIGYTRRSAISLLARVELMVPMMLCRGALRFPFNMSA